MSRSELTLPKDGSKDEMPVSVRAMTPTSGLSRVPENRPFVFEPLCQGWRIMAYKQKGIVTKGFRNQGETLNTKLAAARAKEQKGHTFTFLPIAKEIDEFLPVDVILDGEVVALDKHGHHDPTLLPTGWERNEGSLVYFVHDILYYGEDDLMIRKIPLHERKALLDAIIPASLTYVKPLPHYNPSDGTPQELLERFQADGFVGLVAKDLSSSYKSGPSHEWLSFRVLN